MPQATKPHWKVGMGSSIGRTILECAAHTKVRQPLTSLHKCWLNKVPWPTGSWGVGGVCRRIQQRSSSCLLCGRSSWAVLAQTGASTLWRCPSSFFFPADHGITHPPRCPKEWFWRGCCGARHACCQKRFLWAHKVVDLALHPVLGLVKNFPQAWESVDSEELRSPSPCLD